MTVGVRIWIGTTPVASSIREVLAANALKLTIASAPPASASHADR